MPTEVRIIESALEAIGLHHMGEPIYHNGTLLSYELFDQVPFGDIATMVACRELATTKEDTSKCSDDQ